MHSYVVARDYGFAPNPFYGFCTLATCKPKIRKTAKVGDWVIGTGSRTRGREGCMVFAMQVTDTVQFEEYWEDSRFQQKKPSMRGSKKQAFGDNIYYRDKATRVWHQVDSHHSYPDGTPNEANVTNDTQADRVLISDDYVYWGGSGPALPERLRNFEGLDLCGGRGHKNAFPDEMIEEFIAWLRLRGDKEYCGVPLDWVKSP